MPCYVVSKSQLVSPLIPSFLELSALPIAEPIVVASVAKVSSAQVAPPSVDPTPVDRAKAPVYAVSNRDRDYASYDLDPISEAADLDLPA